MLTRMHTETPGTDDRPEELPEGDRPEELPPTEPDSPEIGQPSPGPGPDEPAPSQAGMQGYLQRVEHAVAGANPRRTLGGWRDRLRGREMHEPRERPTHVA